MIDREASGGIEPQAVRHIEAGLDDVYSSRRKIALIVLSTDLVSEGECRAMCPSDEVAIAATRIRTHNPLTIEALRGHETQIAEAASLFDPIGDIDAFAYACTAGSAANRREDLDAKLQSVGSRARLTSPLYGALEAFTALGVSRVSMMTPYPNDVVYLLQRYLAANGIETVSLGSFHFDIDFEICSIAPKSILESALLVDNDKAQACFIPCTGLRSSSIIAPLEARLGKPVVAAHQAMLWHALRLAGFRKEIQGFGALMATDCGATAR